MMKPIDADRRAHLAQPFDTNPNQSLHWIAGSRFYCGARLERGREGTVDLGEVTCQRCLAALRADG